MMKKGICLTAIFPEAMFDKDKLVEVLKKTAETRFYNGVEYYFEGSQEDYREIRALIKELGLYSVFLAGYPMKNEKIDISAKEEHVRKQGVAFCKELLERAETLGCDKALLLSGPVWKERDEEHLVEQLCKSIRELTTIPSTKVGVSLEFFNTQGEPYLAFGEFETIVALCEKLKGVNFGITYDFSHAAQLGMNIPETVKALLPYIHHLHIANSVSRVSSSSLYGDKHPLFGVKDEDLNIEEVGTFLRNFQKEGYLKEISICSMEVISREDYSNEWYFEQTLKQAQILLENIFV